MEANGESIYGTDRSLFVDLPWGWSTTAKDKLYLHVIDWPTDGKLIVPGLQSKVKKAYLLEDTKKKSLTVRGIDDGKSITVGKRAPNDVASVVVLELAEAPQVHNTFRQTPGESMKFSTAIAQVEGENASYNYGTATRKGNFVQDIKTSNDRVGWNFLLRTPGKYRVLIEYSAQTPQAGSEFALKVGDLATFHGIVRGTADWEGSLVEVQRQTFDAHERHNNLWTFQQHELGTLYIAEPGAHSIEVAPISIAKDYLAFMKSVTLELVE
jgi:alpha-L-fucosidase